MKGSAFIFLSNIVAVMIMLLAMTAIIGLRGVMARKAVFRVIAILREHGSLCNRTASTPDELGLAPPDPLRRLTGLKDYKPQALDALIEGGVVRLLDDGRVCLAEDRLGKVTGPGLSERD